jgi:hypothetical protein
MTPEAQIHQDGLLQIHGETPGVHATYVFNQKTLNEKHIGLLSQRIVQRINTCQHERLDVAIPKPIQHCEASYCSILNEVNAKVIRGSFK